MDRLIALIESFDIHHQIALSSFNHDYHLELTNRGLEIEYEFGFLYNNDGEEEKFYDWSKSGTVNLYAKHADEEKVRIAHQNGRAVQVWFWRDPLESEETFINLIRMGVDIICTNYPDIALKVRNEYFSRSDNGLAIKKI